MRPQDHHLSMEHFVGAFILLAGGLLLSVFVFVGEILIERNKHY